jgi:hypothetical protein
MRNVIALVFATLLLGSSAAAQIPTKGNVYFGYSYYNTNLSSIDRGNLNGWNGSLEGKFLPWVGLVADFSGIMARRISRRSASRVRAHR